MGKLDRRSFIKKTSLSGAALASSSFFSSKAEAKKFIKSPFSNLDTLATNDWWNIPKNPIINLKVNRDQVIAFGIYTLSNKTLKLSAQLFPLYPEESRDIILEINKNGKWEKIKTNTINDIGWSTTFKISNWDDSKDTKYKLKHGNKAEFVGKIRKNPIEKEDIVLAAFSCNSNKDRGDRDSYIKNINHINPDILFFAGDQSYDHKEHTAAWLKFGMQFREIFRERPCITIPDDHDIGQGNLWGEYGKVASTPAGNDGGYFYHREYIKMVERAQTNHLPDPYDKTPIKQGIGVYYTNIEYGNIDFAIIEDRKFKSGPKGKIPKQGPRPDHINNPNYDPKSIDLEGLSLLGERQHKFLREWGKKQNNSVMKAVLSQTGFCGGAHLHGDKYNRLHADLDSNGWPQKGRNKALELIKKANAVHIAGDQHLATVIHHGIKEYEDGPWAFVVPAIINNYYSRWWWPKNEKSGDKSNNILPWNGRYLDGFNNKITMHAYANPDSDSNGSGYGIIRFNKLNKKVTFECWPRNQDVRKNSAKQFKGWPVTVSLG
mgnify:FL=1|tara:strand:- start:1115 stop:2752 length:1638 start_codon:yes stop_codon:yes gene_type:complete